MRFVARLPDRPVLVGVVHLLPLPGAPRPSPGLDAVESRALADAAALIAGGADGFIVENLGDAPFVAGPVDAFTIAAMARLARRLRDAHPTALIGVNVLRNDARGALAVAAAAGADFVRVNVHTGVMVTDQGVITGDARGTLLERNRLDAPVAIVADVHVKHAVPLGPVSLEDAARDTWTRGAVDALVITGSGTGRPLDPVDLDRARSAAPGAPVWAGSGLDPTTARAWKGRMDGAIVGTWLHRDGDLEAPVDAGRVRALRAALA